MKCIDTYMANDQYIYWIKNKFVLKRPSENQPRFATCADFHMSLTSSTHNTTTTPTIAAAYNHIICPTKPLPPSNHSYIHC
ncbi:hypothetical protein QVD17_26293 [Tagetes erecta]|uniref:Uncharacterized protein n=1 Tax=Tagetes erecta TaxID=13708 RepID=A0AAD8K696_TARER|nr:hypothetical protein QVD17_26293 [Tagetes erecta]